MAKDKKTEKPSRIIDDVAIHPIYWQIFLQIKKGKHTSTSIAKELGKTQGGIYSRLKKMELTGLLKREEMNFYIDEDQTTDFIFKITNTDKKEKEFIKKYGIPSLEYSSDDDLHSIVDITKNAILNDINKFGIYTNFQGLATTIMFLSKSLLINSQFEKSKSRDYQTELFENFKILVPEFGLDQDFEKIIKNGKESYEPFVVRVYTDSKILDLYEKIKGKWFQKNKE